MILPIDIRSLTEFQRQTKKAIARLKRTGRPEVLTINGEAAIVVQDAAAFARANGPARTQTEAEAVKQALRTLDSATLIPLDTAATGWRAHAAEQTRKHARRKSA